MREGLTDKKYSRIFSELMNAREESDYMPITDYDEEETVNLIEKAKGFLKEMERIRNIIRQREQKLRKKVK